MTQHRCRALQLCLKCGGLRRKLRQLIIVFRYLCLERRQAIAALSLFRLRCLRDSELSPVVLGDGAAIPFALSSNHLA